MSGTYTSDEKVEYALKTALFRTMQSKDQPSAVEKSAPPRIFPKNIMKKNLIEKGEGDIDEDGYYVGGTGSAYGNNDLANLEEPELTVTNYRIIDPTSNKISDKRVSDLTTVNVSQTSHNSINALPTTGTNYPLKSWFFRGHYGSHSGTAAFNAANSTYDGLQLAWDKSTVGATPTEADIVPHLKFYLQVQTDYTNVAHGDNISYGHDLMKGLIGLDQNFSTTIQVVQGQGGSCVTLGDTGKAFGNFWFTQATAGILSFYGVGGTYGEKVDAEYGLSNLATTKFPMISFIRYVGETGFGAGSGGGAAADPEQAVTEEPSWSNANLETIFDGNVGIGTTSPYGKLHINDGYLLISENTDSRENCGGVIGFYTTDMGVNGLGTTAIQAYIGTRSHSYNTTESYSRAEDRSEMVFYIGNNSDSYGPDRFNFIGAEYRFHAKGVVPSGGFSQDGKQGLDNICGQVSDSDCALFIATNGKVGIGTTGPTEKLEVNGWIGRSSHSTGALCGSYNNIEGNGKKTNPIYVIGGNYKPSDTTFSNMYGIGYCHSYESGTGDDSHWPRCGPYNGWGVYVASDGDPRIFMSADAAGPEICMRGSHPTIFFRDTNNRGAALHVNSDEFYILNGKEATDSTGWSTAHLTSGKYYALKIDLDTNEFCIGGDVNLNVNNTQPYDGTGYYGKIKWSTNTEHAYCIVPVKENETTNFGTANYTKLRINWHTGIHLGAHKNYGGTSFFDDALGTSATPGATKIASIGDNGYTWFNQNVGIGTTSPGYKLHIVNPTLNNSIQDLLCLETHVNSQTTVGPGLLFRERWNNGSYFNLARILAMEQSGYGGQLAFFTNEGTGSADNTLIERMRINELGNVGIGTTDPKIRLHVKGYTSGSRLTSYMDDDGRAAHYSGDNVASQSMTGGQLGPGSWSGYTFSDIDSDNNISGYMYGGPVWPSNLGTYVRYSILSGWNLVIDNGCSLIVSSDERIKINIKDVPDDLALYQLRKIPCRYYRYKDWRIFGRQKTIGFIAQEVKEILPMAVKMRSSIIPNIYHMLNNENIIWEEIKDNSDNIIKYKLHCKEEIKTGLRNYDETIDEYKYYNLENCDISGVVFRFYVNQGEGEEQKEIVGNSDDTFTFEEKWKNIFCFGYEVHDFHSLDKNKLFALNFSATQEIDRIQQEEIGKSAEQTSKIVELENEVATLENKVATLESELAAIKQHLGI